MTIKEEDLFVDYSINPDENVIIITEHVKVRIKEGISDTTIAWFSVLCGHIALLETNIMRLRKFTEEIISMLPELPEKNMHDKIAEEYDNKHKESEEG